MQRDSEIGPRSWHLIGGRTGTWTQVSGIRVPIFNHWALWPLVSSQSWLVGRGPEVGVTGRKLKAAPSFKKLRFFSMSKHTLDNIKRWMIIWDKMFAIKNKGLGRFTCKKTAWQINGKVLFLRWLIEGRQMSTTNGHYLVTIRTQEWNLRTSYYLRNSPNWYLKGAITKCQWDCGEVGMLVPNQGNRNRCHLSGKQFGKMILNKCPSFPLVILHLEMCDWETIRDAAQNLYVRMLITLFIEKETEKTHNTLNI